MNLRLPEKIFKTVAGFVQAVPKKSENTWYLPEQEILDQKTRNYALLDLNFRENQQKSDENRENHQKSRKNGTPLIINLE